MADIIQLRRDTAARWKQYNPILLEGEVGYVTDNPNQYKIGDGKTPWNSLPLRGYTGTITQETGSDENAVMSQKAVTEKLSELGSELGESLFCIEGKYIDVNGYHANTSNLNKITDYLPLDGVDSFTIKGRSTDRVLLYAFYDEDKKFIQGVGGNEYTDKEITVLKTEFPENAVYVVFNGFGDKPNILRGFNFNYIREDYIKKIEDVWTRFDNVFVKSPEKTPIEINTAEKYIKISANTVIFRAGSPFAKLSNDVLVDTSSNERALFLIVDIKTLEFKAINIEDIQNKDFSSFGIIAAYNNANGYLLSLNAEVCMLNKSLVYNFVKDSKIIDRNLLKIHPIVETDNKISEAIYDAYEEQYDTSVVYYIRNYKNPVSGTGRAVIIATADKNTGEVVNNRYNTLYEGNAIYKDGNFHVYRKNSFTIAINWDFVQTTGESWYGNCKAVFSPTIANKNSGNYINVCALIKDVEEFKVEQELQRVTKDLTETQQQGYWSGGSSSGYASFHNSDTLRTVTTVIHEGDIITTTSEFTPTNNVPWPLLDKNNMIVQRLANFKQLVITKEMIEQGAERLALCYRTTEQVEQFEAKKETRIFFENQIEVDRLKKENPKYGKKVLLFGDSQIGQCRMENILAAMLNTDVYNLGFGSGRWTWRTTDGSSPWDAFSMVDVADALVTMDFARMDSSVSADGIPSYFSTTVKMLKTLEIGDGSGFIATIAYGGNDYASGIKFGSIDSENKNELYGAINYVVRQLLTAYPSLTLVVVSPTYRVYEKNEDGSIAVDSDDKTVNIEGILYKRYEYCDKILEHARDVHHLPTFDMYRRGGRNKYNIFTICPDGAHPTSELGMQLTAEKYEKILKSF